MWGKAAPTETVCKLSNQGWPFFSHSPKSKPDRCWLKDPCGYFCPKPSTSWFPGKRPFRIFLPKTVNQLVSWQKTLSDIFAQHRQPAGFLAKDPFGHFCLKPSTSDPFGYFCPKPSTSWFPGKRPFRTLLPKTVNQLVSWQKTLSGVVAQNRQPVGFLAKDPFGHCCPKPSTSWFPGKRPFRTLLAKTVNQLVSWQKTLSDILAPKPSTS